jgi:protein TonB
MNAWVLHAPSDNSGALRWGTSAAVIVLLHAGLIALGIAWYAHTPPAGSPMPTILVDLPPVTSSAAPEPQQMDVAPSPQMQQADAPSPPPEPPKQQTAQEQIPVTPPQNKPVVAAPPEQRTEPKPEPPKPAPVKPKPIETKKPSDRPPAPRTTAAPRAERRAPLASARAGAAAGAAALPAYRERLAAHLQRFKQYPSAAKAAGEQGTAMLTFTVDRHGRVLASRLARSSGHAALDAETMAMIRRAQPLPAFPPEMKQASLSFTVPVHFSLR